MMNQIEIGNKTNISVKDTFSGKGLESRQKALDMLCGLTSSAATNTAMGAYTASAYFKLLDALEMQNVVGEQYEYLKGRHEKRTLGVLNEAVSYLKDAIIEAWKSGAHEFENSARDVLGLINDIIFVQQRRIQAISMEEYKNEIEKAKTLERT